MAKYKSKSTIAKYLIEKYTNDITGTIEGTMDQDERKQLRVLRNIINDGKFVISALLDDFPIENAPEDVYLFDLERCMFWRQNLFGYTSDIYSAGTFDLEFAKGKANSKNSNTKIVYFI